VSFQDYRNAQPTAQLTPRNTPEQVHGARAAVAGYVHRCGGDIELLRELVEMIGLQRTTAEITAEAAALADQEETP
jgi:hypothetical protein